MVTEQLSSSGRMNPFDGDDYYAISGGGKGKDGNHSLDSNQQQEDDHKTGNGNSNPFEDSDDESFQRADGTSVEHEHHDELTSTSSNLISDGRNNLSECNSEHDECKEQHLPNQPQSPVDSSLDGASTENDSSGNMSSKLADGDSNPFNDIERGGDVASSVTTDTSSQISSHKNTDAQYDSTSHDQSHEIDNDASHSRSVASRSQSDNSEDNYSDKGDIEEAVGDANGDKETEKHDMPQSSLFRDDITGDAVNSTLSGDTNQSEATIPLLQQHDEAETYWNKEDIGDAVAVFNERSNAYETKQEDVDNPKNESNSFAREQIIVRRSSIPRKKVKNRYCKACVMVTVVWSAMVILVAVALGMDWWGINERLDQTKSESLCTLCAENGGIGFNFTAYTLRPTRKPSLSPASVRPPPESLAEVCAPSILLDHGPTSKNTRDHLVASCATACLPAACCVIDNAEARQSLITMLELQGMGAQAAAFLSTTKNCNVGKNVKVCNSYNTFCSTLYDLEYALKQLPQNMQHVCSNDQAEDTTSISTAYSRQYNLPTTTSEKCMDACLPVACCYESIIEPTPVSRKRKRQPTNTVRRNTQETRSCSDFSASGGSVNAKICHAYAPFCNSFDSSSKPSSSPTTFTMPTSTPSSVSSSVPSLAPSLVPSLSSVPSSVPPSRLPTVPYSTTLVNTARPSSNTTNSGLPVIISNTTQPSLIPSLISTTDNSSSAVPQPSNAPTNSYHPTINSSSSFINMNSSLPSVVPSLNSTTESSFISSLMPTPNVTSQPSSRPSNSFYPTFNSSSSVINVISSPPSNNASSTLTPSQHPTISALPTREANYTHNASIASNYSTNPESSVPIVALSNLGPTNCVITETVFNTIAPQAAPPFSYAGFCKAVSDWNMRNPNNPIFVADQTHELAAFFGNTLHESDGFTAPREYKVCRESITDSNGKMYCKPPLYNGGLYTDDYCSTEHNRTSDPDGCACLRQVPEALSQPGYVEADLLFFGRGALHLSWNYNYIDAGGAIGVDLCTNPDLAASDEEYVWTSAFYFWTMNTGKGETCTQSVAAGSFGGTVNIINGGLECPATGLSSASSVISRLDDYCAASTALGADSLLDLKGCKGLQSQFDFCSSTKLCSSCSEWA